MTIFNQQPTFKKSVHYAVQLCYTAVKVPINPKLLFYLNKCMSNSEQNAANFFDFGQNRNFL